MGTNHLTLFNNSDGEEICVMYGVQDGRPRCYGLELAKFIKDIKLVNGIDIVDGGVANGIECLVAQVIKHFKSGPGDFYIFPAGKRNMFKEYIYTVSENVKKKTFDIECQTHFIRYGSKTIFKGTADEFYSWILKEGI